MSKSEEMLRLERDMNKKPELKKKLDAEIIRIAEAGEAESNEEAMVKAAAALGYAIKPEELDRAEAGLEQLDDDELDAVGGYSIFEVKKKKIDPKRKKAREDEAGHNNWCLTGWHCYTVTKHSDTESKNVACWENYSCVVISK